jgi:hypothetical protein
MTVMIQLCNINILLYKLKLETTFDYYDKIIMDQHIAHLHTNYRIYSINRQIVVAGLKYRIRIHILIY